MSRAELEMISSVENNIIGSQASNPLISIVQDALLGSYLLTKTNDSIPKDVFFQICIKTEIPVHRIFEKLDKAQMVFKKHSKKNIPYYSGKTLVSLLFPDDFCYTNQNKANPDEPFVRIDEGIMYEGTLNKANLKATHMSFVRILHKEYDNSTALFFANNIQFMANEFIMYHGFSIGIEDCIATKATEIKKNVMKCFMEAEAIEESTENAHIKEAKISQALAKAKDIGMKIAKEAMNPKNNFLDTVISGSKGDYFNITQITGLLGQQNLTGKRVGQQLNKGRRTLPHYPLDFKEKSEEYKSRGFIRHSFIHGLTPQEFWIHAMTGREGITDKQKCPQQEAKSVFLPSREENILVYFFRGEMPYNVGKFLKVYITTLYQKWYE